MKRTIAVILTLVITLSMCSCSNTTEGTALTLSNYEDYLNISASVTYDTKSATAGHWGVVTKNVSIKGYIRSEGVSTNFNYNNVKIKVHFFGTYGTTTLASVGYSADEGSVKTYDFTLEFSPNIAGSGHITGEPVIEAPANKAIVVIDSQYEVLNVSGWVSPA